SRGKRFLGRLDRALLRQALVGRGLEQADRGGRRGRDRRWQRGGENEARRVRADGIDDRAAGGDVAAHRAEGLGQGSLDDVDPRPTAVLPRSSRRGSARRKTPRTPAAAGQWSRSRPRWK